VGGGGGGGGKLHNIFKAPEGHENCIEQLIRLETS
jgi:hypothetical protein